MLDKTVCIYMINMQLRNGLNMKTSKRHYRCERKNGGYLRR